MSWWDYDNRVDRAIEVLRTYPKWCDNAEVEISDRLGRQISYDSLLGALKRRKLGPPGSFCTGTSYDCDLAGLEDDEALSVGSCEAEPTSCVAFDRELIEKILAAVRHHSLDYVALSDKVNAPSDEVKRTVQSAIVEGYDLCINDGHVSRRALLGDLKKKIPCWNERDGRHLVGFVSDTHIGNKWTAEDELTRFIRWLYSQGVRTIIHPGDVLDGVSDKLKPEQYLVGFDGQSLQATRVFPNLPGLCYFSQTGNHDEYTSDLIGMDSGRSLENRFREVGRDDWHHVGRCRSSIRVESATFELIHPHGGTGSNSGVLGVLEAHVNECEVLPHFMVTGHFHKFCSGVRKGCHMISAATWQRKGSPFSNRIKGPWAVGGVILDYNVDQDGRVDDVSTRYVQADMFAVAA